MERSCQIPTSAEAKYLTALSDGQSAMLRKVFEAIQEAHDRAAAEFDSSDLEGQPPPSEYFASVVHQAMYCTMCGADPETFSGGDPQIAIHVIRNSQNIAKHYWGAQIEPYPR